MLDDVSRETHLLLEDYVASLLKWTQKINLIAKASERDIWQRHVADSVQLYKLGGRGKTWVDLGSGGGLPGLVIAIMAKEHDPDRVVTMVESDQRKCVFLREMISRHKLNAQVVNARIEAVPPLGADVLSARALTALPALLGFTQLHRSKTGIALFPKGVRHMEEIADARKTWQFDHVVHPSRTDSEGVIVEVGKLFHV
ncbi:16S rRNA (guanine(527)-N(7))-methyltransferase RsmG [Falsirhodobacter sp. 20TX0035]|uniref:16S rRNA (guanine(527)-N(7))-methyltransferase RsmG n=1 Tax=Falsirhodobacter sp. 20TX0035 TaxID=3022019 RepID=UPI00232F4199|nr:16S rRNA (guanine(527)-N(7))-methyltransferase RsmG [Falsirhodobacter sp. 20TX0035]MDB6452757.1 16S rRNA (guanine(527)-N(7))-methyltransferase RsmG [Falsirhodobacter sp. 20TX0035]